MPFFAFLDWNGWFRADPLEEVVGLDMSYHRAIQLVPSSDDHEDHSMELYLERRIQKVRERIPSSKRFPTPETGETAIDLLDH